jgi:hypothetical protein
VAHGLRAVRIGSAALRGTGGLSCRYGTGGRFLLFMLSSMYSWKSCAGPFQENRAGIAFAAKAGSTGEVAEMVGEVLMSDDS